MSSECEHAPRAPASKQRSRRPYRSCDFCRQRKSQRDGLTMANGAVTQCSNCLVFGVKCTYITPTKQRGPKMRLVEELREQIATLEAKLRSLSVCALCSQPFQSQQDVPSPPSVIPEPPKNGTAAVEAAKADITDDITEEELVESFRRISIEGIKGKYFGPASSYALLGSAFAEKVRLFGRPPIGAHSRRQIYWDLLPWEKGFYNRRPKYVYPASDLIDSLLELYFTNIHPILPVFHRPSFERDVAEGLHLEDTKFGATLLAVLALASRYSDDPRVFLDGETSLSSGWKFIAQVEIFGKCHDPGIHDVQFCLLAALYSLGTSSPQASWLYIGVGVRWLQHRRENRPNSEGHKFEDEHWNRLFWSFFALDRLMCSFVGCSPAIHLEDYDFDPVLEVDDEYWERGFTQPLGMPSLLSYFTSLIRLCEILGDTLHRLYSSKKKKARMGWTGTNWEQDTVAELDSAMNNFFDSIPAHLRRDPNGQDVYLDQSTTLHTMYYYIQIMIHRRYIHTQSPLAAPSLSICTSAARSGLSVANIWLDRLHRLPFPWIQNFVVTSAVILLLNIFVSRRAGLLTEADKRRDLAQVRTALEILKFVELRSHRAGRLWDLVQELQSLDGPAPRIEVNQSQSGMPFGDPSPGNQPGASFSRVVDTQHGQPFEPGMSIEQLLAETPTWNSSAEISSGTFLDDEIMSMWMAAPTDLMDTNQWDTYMENLNGIR
ncbi:fungal-specific transcription factor domain-containing protein [Mycena maculata]|uniref:Fungal-specific transcription factor domain-containing protein n=1 Tax=Mycena maculata TaxID=230809 RepID=A0AAD7HQM3_9AGAR|nr:fungal-specific transcription factor domain-containing protein [Mycena maculata]